MAGFGDLLDRREIPAVVPGSQAWWVRFASTDLFDRPTESTGVVVAPAGAGRDRPVVVWCHGTTGLGDGAVPSRQPSPTGELITHPEPVGPDDVDRGVPGMAAYLAAGAVVVAPDYQGLGTEGFHHYCVNATGARDAVASVRAAVSMSETGAGHRLGVLGWSEGGGMALGVAELPGEVRDGTDLCGVATFAPGVPGLVLRHAFEEVRAAGSAADPHVLMFLAVHGWLLDGLEPTDLLAPAAAALVADVWNDLPVHLLGERAEALAGTGPLMQPEPVRADEWIERTALPSAGTRTPEAPVLVATGLVDTTVPPHWQQAYVDAARALGGDLTVEEFPDDDHCEVPFTASRHAEDFLLGHLGA